MLINVAPPPLPGFVGFNDAAEPRYSGMSGDPFGITDVLGIVSNFIQAKKADKEQDKQIGVERAQLKQQKLVDTENLAVAQATTLSAPSQQQRQDQVYALMAIGGAAVIIAGLFIFGAVKK